ncbi:hypothetical protein AYO40_02905 [Planctomycetaceae bacterium SCGC AG-212-D15]|nr:hypothetical protein AYO40_02905 [Planctomycetaceae bacterium SCGC AG-212-D15]
MPISAISDDDAGPGGIRPWQIILLVAGLLLAAAGVVALRSKNEPPPPPPPPAVTEKPPPPTLEDYEHEGKKLPQWIASLKDKDPKVRQESATALTGVKPAGCPLLVPLLLDTLKDDEPHVRRLSAYVLANIRPEPDKVLPALATALRDKDPEVRRQAAVALIQLGRARPESLRHILRSASADKSKDVRQLADYIRDNIKPAEVAVSTEKVEGKTPPGAYGVPDSLVGKTAPKLEQKDLDGAPFNLRQHRGKVVLVAFWGDWSQVSRDLYPMEKGFVERYKSKPFLMIGVNSDEDKEKLQKRIKEEKINWRSIWDPRPGGTRDDEWGGPIHDEWNVEAMPTFYIVDPNGIVWCKFKDKDRLDAALSVIMAENEKK